MAEKKKDLPREEELVKEYLQLDADYRDIEEASEQFINLFQALLKSGGLPNGERNEVEYHLQLKEKRLKDDFNHMLSILCEARERVGGYLAGSLSWSAMVALITVNPGQDEALRWLNIYSRRKGAEKFSILRILLEAGLSTRVSEKELQSGRTPVSQYVASLNNEDLARTGFRIQGYKGDPHDKRKFTEYSLEWQPVEGRPQTNEKLPPDTFQ